MQSLNMLLRQMKMGSTSIQEKEGREGLWKRSHERYEHSIFATISHKKWYSPHYAIKKSYTIEDSSNNPEMSLVAHHKIRYVDKNMQWELKEIKPPTFDGEHKKGEDVEALMLGMRKYLHIHN